MSFVTNAVYPLCQNGINEEDAMVGWASPRRRLPGRRWDQPIEAEPARDGAVRFELRSDTRHHLEPHR